MADERERVKNHRLYFGRTMPFTDRNGNFYPEAFFVVDSQPYIDLKSVTIRAVFYRSTDSFDYGEPAISEVDGGVRKKTYSAANWDKYMAQNSALVAQTAMAIHATWDAIIDTPKSDGTFESFFANASPIIMPEG
jgi:hypothetical protein